jgi:putative membrane protein
MRSDRRTQVARIAGILTVAAVLTAGTAEAHGENDHAWWAMWTFAPVLMTVLVAGTVLYSVGLRNLWRRAGRGRGVSQLQAACYYGGVLAVIAALVSPIDAISEQLQWVHMVQHMILMLIAAPLFVVAAPLFVALWALPSASRKRVAIWWQNQQGANAGWRLLTHPFSAWMLYAVTMWLWHLPALYEAALHSELVHDIQHVAFMTTSVLFWWVLINPMGRLRMSRGAGVLYLFTTSLHGGLLGAFLALAPAAVYGTYELTAPGWGLSALEDQQAAGMIKWMIACLIYIVLAGLLVWLWFRESAAEDRRLDHYATLHAMRRLKEERRVLLREAEGGAP